MKVKIPYGKDHRSFEIPDGNSVTFVHPLEVEVVSPHEILHNALSNPHESPGFEDFISHGGKTLVLVNDAARSTPTTRVLDVIIEKLLDTDCRFLVATGTHRAPTAEELEYIFGHHLARLSGLIEIHDCRDNENLVSVGVTVRGTEFAINKLAFWADRIVIIGSVEPHFFAGFTGGRKSLLPGISAYRTVEQNHSHAMSENSQPARLDGNPVHEDMMEAVEMLSDLPIFSIQTVLDSRVRIYAAAAGDLNDSFFAAVESARKLFCRQAIFSDIVITAASYPLDMDLYQTQKAIEHARLALKEGGAMIVLSQCREGIGPDSFFRLMQSCNTKEEMSRKISGEYKLGYHKVKRLIELSKMFDIFAVTDLEPEILNTVLMKPCESVQIALEQALDKVGPEAKILIITDGSLTVPVVN